MSEAIDAIKGSAPPLITPFKDGAVDYQAYALSLIHISEPTRPY